MPWSSSGVRGGEGEAEWRRRVRKQGGSGEHGTSYRYVTGCRCQPFIDARWSIDLDAAADLPGSS
jgi:hypothetical protein